MSYVACPHCLRRIEPSATGNCPECKAALPAQLLEAQPPARPSREAATSRYVTTQPFSLQAARFSALAPVCMFCLASLTQRSVERDNDGSLRFVTMLIIQLLMFAALALGFAGVVGGLRRRAWGTVALGVIGCVINGAFVFLVVLSYVGALMRV